MAKILVVEDESNILSLLTYALKKEGYEIIAAADGHKALASAQVHRPDLIILDLMLPGIDGLEVCKILRKRPETAYTPIIMLTAKSGELDTVIGLEMGADDYVAKPFSPRELVARVRVRLRNQPQSPSSIQAEQLLNKKINYGPLAIEPDKYEAYFNGRKLDLTLKEFGLLNILMSNPGRVFNRDYLLSTIWGFDHINDSRTVDVHIHHLRQKIEGDPAKPVFLETVRGVGYRLKELAKE